MTSIIGGRQWHGIWWIRWSPTVYWRSLQLMRCVMWRAGWMLKERGHLCWINDWIIQWRRYRYHRWWKLITMVITLLNFSVSFPLLQYARSYVLISLPFVTSPFYHQGLLLDNIGIGTKGLVVRTYFWRFQYILWPYVTVGFGKLPHL